MLYTQLEAKFQRVTHNTLLLVETLQGCVSDTCPVVLSALPYDAPAVQVVVVDEVLCRAFAGLLDVSRIEGGTKNLKCLSLVHIYQNTRVRVCSHLVIFAQVGQRPGVGFVVQLTPIHFLGNLTSHEVVAHPTGRLQHAVLECDGRAIRAEPGLANAKARILGQGAVLPTGYFDEEDGHFGGVNHLAGDKLSGVNIDPVTRWRLKSVLDEFQRGDFARFQLG